MEDFLDFIKTDENLTFGVETFSKFYFSGMLKTDLGASCKTCMMCAYEDAYGIRPQWDGLDWNAIAHEILGE